MQTCPHCGKVFEPGKRWQRFCSNRCKAKHWYAANAGRTRKARATRAAKAAAKRDGEPPPQSPSGEPGAPGTPAYAIEVMNGKQGTYRQRIHGLPSRAGFDDASGAT